MDKHRNKAIWMTVAAALFWSTGGLFIKILPQDALTIVGYRSFYAALLFIPIFGRKLLLFNRITLITALFYAPLLIMFVTATKLTTAANAIFLQYSAPAFVLIAEPYFTKTRLKKINIITVVLCFIGMTLFFVEQFTRPESWLGILIAAGSGIVLAGFLLGQKMNRSEYQPGAVFWGNILVCLFTLPWIINTPLPTMAENGYLMLLGFGQLGLGYALFVYGQKYLPALESSLIGMIEPLLNPVWVFIGYGENPGLWAVAGGLLIIGTLVFRMYWLEVQSKKSGLTKAV
ncbi:MAG: EamA family transporter [Saprospiraceae bacterium]|nr:MAG: permease [Bacteroidetes bacterium OLB9]MCO6464279.1 EamA family transporter [Saprospiraceae bacterium]MCZ2337851.1 EamA family transporter [Chitinophagales bacterium]